MINTNLTDYQVKLVLNDDVELDLDLFKSAGEDLYITAFNKVTPVNFMIESWSSSQAVVWVKVPSILADSTTTILLWGGNPDYDNNGGDYDNVFTKIPDGDTGLAALWHMDDESPSTTIADASGNNHPGTLTGYNSPTPAIPQWSGSDGGNWDGANPEVIFSSGDSLIFSGQGGTASNPKNYVSIGNTLDELDEDTGVKEYTIMAWVWRDNSANSGAEVIFNHSSNGYHRLLLQLDSSLNPEFLSYESGYGTITDTSTTVNDSNWHHVVGVRTNQASGGDYIARLYVDGVLKVTGPMKRVIHSGTEYTTIGIVRDGYSGGRWLNPLNAIVDEVAVYGRALSGPTTIGNGCSDEPDNEVCAHYYRRKYADTLPSVAVGDPQVNPSVPWLPGYAHRWAITVENNTGSTLTNHQVQVTFANGTGTGQVDFTEFADQTSGTDMQFTGPDAETTIAFFRSDWQAGTSAEVWVKLPALSPSETTTIYLYGGYSGAQDESSYSATMTKIPDDDTGLVALWHMDGGSGQISDSVGGDNDSTTNTADWVTTDGGQWDGVDQQFTTGNQGHLDFESDNNDYVEVGTTNIPVGDSSRTIMAWVKLETLNDGTGDHVVVFTGTYTDNDMFNLSFNTNAGKRLRVWGWGHDISGTYSFSPANWYHIAATYDSATGTIKSYVNGAIDINQTTTDYNTTMGNVYIGGRGTNNSFDGLIDEVAIYDRVLSGPATNCADNPDNEICAIYYRRKYLATQPGVTGIGSPVYHYAPAVPTDLVATPFSEVMIKLSWTDTTYEDGYKIERSEVDTSNWSQIDTAPADATSYSDVNLSVGTTYYYRMRAYNSIGNSVYAVFPGTETSVSSSISTGTDDAEEDTITGNTGTSSSDLELGEDGTLVQVIGLRFQNVQIPKGATITNAYVEFECDVGTWTGDVPLTVVGQDADNPGTFSAGTGNYDISNISLRPETSASVSWTITQQWAVDSKYSSDDISSIIQEIIDRAGWSSGNSMVIKFYGVSGTRREAESFEGESSAVPRLVVNYAYTAGATPLSNPVGYWKFDDYNNGVADDSGTGNNDGSLQPGYPTNNPTWLVNGKSNYALSFDGTDDYVEVTDNAELTPSNITVEAWIKTAGSNDYAGIVTKYDSGGNYYPGYMLDVWAGSASEAVFTVRNNSAQAQAHGTTNVEDDVWHHLAGTYDGNKAKMYVDGILEGSVSFTGGLLDSVGDHLYIGQDDYGSNRRFNGLIDEVKIYDRVLDANQAEANYLELGAEISSLIAADASGGGAGIQAGDTVTITFNAETNGPAIDASNINSVLSVSSKTWLDGSGAIGGAVWSTATDTNDTLTITLSDTTSAPTVAPSDTVTLDYPTNKTVRNKQGGPIMSSGAITGSF